MRQMRAWSIGAVKKGIKGPGSQGLQHAACGGLYVWDPEKQEV